MVDSGQRAKAVVLYHYPCPDGIFAALAAHLYHSAIGCPALYLPNTVYEPIRVQDITVEGVDVFYLLDYAGPPQFAVELAHKAQRVVVLDHHKTALETLPANGEGPQNLHCILDMNRSGATLAYDYFQQKLQGFDGLSSPPSSFVGSQAQGKSLVAPDKLRSVQTLFQYVEDADLWKWKLPESKAVSSGLNDLKIEFNASKNPMVFKALLQLNANDLISRGRESLKTKQGIINGVLETSFVLALGGGVFGECLAVRADDAAHLRSELGNQLAAKSHDLGLLPIGAVVYSQPDYPGSETQYKVSLRSIGSVVDTTKISEAHGGGGHRGASSFLIPREEFERWKISQ